MTIANGIRVSGKRLADQIKKNMASLVVFLNGDRGLVVASSLVEHGFKNLVIVSMAGIKNENKIAKFCITNKLAHVISKNPNKDKTVLSLVADLAIIAGFSLRLAPLLLQKPRLGTINLHAGKLPGYRGGSPLNWQLINGEQLAWCSVIEATERFDQGRVLLEGAIELNDNKTIKDVHEEANQCFSDLCVRAVNMLLGGSFKAKEQNEELATYWHQRNDADGHIKWHSMSARQVFNLVRAVTHPYPGAFSYLEGEVIRIWSVELVDQKIKGVAGRIVNVHNEGPLVVCNDFAIKITDYSSTSGKSLEPGFRLT